MRSKIITIIMTVVIVLMINVFALLGMVLWNEIKKMETSIQPEIVKTILSEENGVVEENFQTSTTLENPFDKIQTGIRKEEPVKEIEGANITNYQYFYHQLEEEAKIIYQAFESNKENMKTGTYKIQLGNSFSDLLSHDEGQERLGEYYQSAIEAYTYDHPEAFYLSPNKMYLNIETTTRGKNVTYDVSIDNGKEANYLIDEFSSKEQIDTAIHFIEQIRDQILQNKRSTVYDNVKMVHDYLVENIEYEITVSKSNIYNIYGAMIGKEAVCEGYARSFKYLMDSMRIPCTLVIGKGTNSEGKSENHAWNYVQVQGEWYAIDTTWDDPVSATGWVSPSSKYRYFLKGTADMEKDHVPSGHFTEDGKLFYYPSLSKENYE